MKHRIAPHGNVLVNRVVEGARAGELRAEAGGLKRVNLSAKQSCDLEMISIGAFSPLKGFMGRADFERVCREMKLASGHIWPIPILLSVEAGAPPKVGERVALHAPNGVLQSVMTVQEVFEHDKALEIPSVFRTEDAAHPGVAQVMAEGRVCLAGPVETLTVCVDPSGPEAFLDHRLTPAQTRAAFDQRGWGTVAAFQTRNPIHRAHEYLCKVAQEVCDGLLVHPLVGETKEGDIPAKVRMDCYKVLLENYFVPERTLLSVMPAAMRYAGPREAILHALVRKNYGCTHFIVGRDHAGVGNYYGSYDAQRIFDELDAADLAITPLKFEHSAYSKRAGGMVSPKTFPNIPGDQVSLSGTKVREMLAAGQRPPEEFTRGEVADVLIRWATGKG
ncbi:MAG: sulfate adenylyltransferase [Phycisphaerae bacterium]|nr:sulfate adenylyltransferase [Phycisphaerae bacterium]